MGGVLAPAEPGVKLGFAWLRDCGFLLFLAIVFGLRLTHRNTKQHVCPRTFARGRLTTG